ncbi:hypothetical protein CHU98_g7057 [Xylaria longipes]|nr:hypothetical protein CHU98_g7057 [Xylaria longipes]
MSRQPTYPPRTQQGASSWTSHSSRHTSTQYPVPQHYQAGGMLQTPSQAHMNNHRFGGNDSMTTYTQSTAGSQWQHQAPNTARPQGSTSGTYSRFDPAADTNDLGARSSGADNAQYGSNDRKASAGGAGADDKRESGSIWERKANKLGGHDGGAGSAFRDRTPLPEWLREP